MNTFRALFIGILSLFLIAASCQGKPQDSQATLMASGKALKAVGQEWLLVNEGFVRGCAPTAPMPLTPAQCDKARQFGAKFKLSYQPQDAKGGKKGGAIEAQYDIAKNT